MVNYPFKIRVRRQRKVVLLEMLVKASGSSWYVKESVELGDGSLKEALAELLVADLVAVPSIKEVLIPEST